MKKLITVITVLVFTMTVNAQFQTTNPYGELKIGFNFPQNGGNNKIAANYAATGKLPQGYYTQTAQQICQSQGAVDMWVRYDVAADVNKEINGGHIANPAEIFIMTPQGRIHSAARCGNHVTGLQFHKNPVVIVNVTTQQVDLTQVYAGQNETHSRLKRIDKRMDSITYNQDVIVDNQVAITKRMALNQQVLVDKLYEMTQSQLRTEKYARQGRNWSIAGTVFSAISATAATVDVLNGDGNASNVAHYFNTVTNTTNTTNNTTTIPPTTNPPTNGGGAGPAGNG